LPYLALLAALSGFAGSLLSGPDVEQALWSPDTLARAAVVDDFHGSVLSAAEALLGVPYHFGGAGPGTCPTGEHASCADCSGLVAAAYASAGVRLPHSSEELLGVGTAVSRGEALPGDVLVLQAEGSPAAKPNHSGIYVGNGLFIHACSRGVRLDDLDGPYWGDPRRPRLRGIRRIGPP